MKVGFIGLGLMGYNMACRLSSSGFRLVVYNRTMSKALRFVDECGGEAVNSPRDVGDRSEVIHVMVSDNEALGNILYGSEGLLASAKNFKVVVQSTITPQYSLSAKASTEALGKAYVEAPVLGSVTESREGKLITYVGGKAEDAGLPTLKALSKEIFYVGEVPKASAVKLAINNLFLTSVAALAESIGLAIGWGVSEEEVLTYLKGTWLRFLVERYEVRGFNEGFPTRFSLRLAAKDLSYVSSALSKVGLPAGLAASAADIFNQASNSGLSGKDYSNILLFLKKLATSGRV